MVANLPLIAFLPVMSLALGVVLAGPAPALSAIEAGPASVAAPLPLLRNGTGRIIDPVFGPRVPGQSVVA